MTKELKQLNNLIFHDRLQISDAVIWLQGDRLDRGPKTLELYKQGWAKKVVVSGNDLRIGKARPGEDNISLEEMLKWLKTSKVKSADIILDKNSFNTKDQAVNSILLAQKKGWRSLIVVGSWPYYQFRVFLTFLKAAERQNWQGRIINAFAVMGKKQKPGGRSQTAGELLKQEVKKLSSYANDVVSLKAGIKYLQAKNPQLNFRKAKLKDAKFLWQLRNDLEVRKNSFSPEMIKWDNHINWLKKALKDNSRTLCVIEDESRRAVGQARFDKRGKSSEISVSLHKKVRHKGLGVPAIALATDYFLKHHRAVNRVVAKIKRNNKPSVKAFLRAGYHLTTNSTAKILTLSFSRKNKL